MALTCPLLLLLAFASADFGRIIHAYLAVSSASRAAAEYGSTHSLTPHTSAAWEANVRKAADAQMQGLQNYSPQLLDVQIAPTHDDENLLRVAVEVKYPFRMAVNSSALPSSVLLRHRVVMRQSR
jgi:Flp pilus assembly protein TadG